MHINLLKLQCVADYQFGKNVGQVLFPENIKIVHSKRTGRIRYIFLGDKRLATLRPTDGLFSLSIEGAMRLFKGKVYSDCSVYVKNSVSKFISDGGDVFSQHVVKASGEIRSKDEVLVLDEDHHFLGVGRASMSCLEMKAFKTGVAVKVKKGNKES